MEALLQSVTIDQGTAGSATTTPPTMPVADPMSHTWASSNKRVATVDPVTGKVTAVKAGTTTISVTTGGITAGLTLTVPRA